MADDVTLYITAQTLEGTEKYKFPDGLKMLKQLLTQGIEQEKLNKLLTDAVRNDHIEAVQVLVEHGAKADQSFGVLETLANKSSNPKLMLSLLESAGLGEQKKTSLDF